MKKPTKIAMNYRFESRAFHRLIKKYSFENDISIQQMITNALLSTYKEMRQ